MRPYILKILLLIIAATVSLNLHAQTTLEEYNYLTKGYKVQTESGLDMKKGYELSDIANRVVPYRQADLKVLYRLKQNKKEIAAYLVIYQRDYQEKEYICIPNPKSDDEVMNKYWTAIYDGGGDSSFRLQLILYLVTSKLVW